ncbi:MAG: hypothetical protein ACOYM2_20605 [Rectinemataceae bacterium]
MGVYIHYGLATDLVVKKEETRECKIRLKDVLEEVGRFYPVDVYTVTEDKSAFYFAAQTEHLCPRFDALLERMRLLFDQKDDEQYATLRQFDWEHIDREILIARSKEASSYHFQDYDCPLPDRSRSYSFGNDFEIDHRGILFAMEGKVLAETMTRTLLFTTLYMRHLLADLPQGRFFKVFLNL